MTLDALTVASVDCQTTDVRQDARNWATAGPMELLKTEFVQGDPPVLRVAGEIDLATADTLRAALEQAASTDPAFVVDMAGVTFFDVTGLRVVLEAAESCDGERPLTLLNAPRVAWLLEVVGLSELSSVVVRASGDSHGR